jgi:hypothetical protein
MTDIRAAQGTTSQAPAGGYKLDNLTPDQRKQVTETADAVEGILTRWRVSADNVADAANKLAGLQPEVADAVVDELNKRGRLDDLALEAVDQKGGFYDDGLSQTNLDTLLANFGKQLDGDSLKKLSDAFASTGGTQGDELVVKLGKAVAAHGSEGAKFDYIKALAPTPNPGQTISVGHAQATAIRTALESVNPATSLATYQATVQHLVRNPSVAQIAVDSIHKNTTNGAIAEGALRAVRKPDGSYDLLIGSKNTPAPMSVTKGNPFLGYGSHPSTDLKGTLGGLSVESDKVQFTSRTDPAGSQTGTTGLVKGLIAKKAGVDGYVPKFFAKAELVRESAITLGAKNNAGNTEFMVEASTKVVGSAGAGGGKKGASVEVGAGAGARVKYEVSLPGENQSASAALRVNPFNPSTIPVGGRVTLNGEAFSETSLAASFRQIGVELKEERGKGVSYVVERVDQNTVRVMMGPTESVKRFVGAGLQLSSSVSVMVGAESSLAGGALRTADFKLSTAEGRAAYSYFTTTGKVAHLSPGVDNVATISRADYSSQAQLRAKLGPLGVEVGGEQNTGTYVTTTYPDGSFAVTTQARYGAGVPLHVTQRYDANGAEIISQRTYQYEVAVNRDNVQMLNTVLTGRPGAGGPAQPGKAVVLTFNERQMQALVGQAERAVDAHELGAPTNLRILVQDYDGNRGVAPGRLAVSMVRNLGSDPYGFVERLYKISSAADGDPVVNNRFERLDVDVKVK